MGWPQITWIVLTSAGVAVHIVKHGQPREPFNMWTTLTATAIVTGLLYAGGFFG